MERLQSPSFPTTMLRNGQTQQVQVPHAAAAAAAAAAACRTTHLRGASQGVCELGVYGALLRDDCGADLLNCTAGYLLRTKRAEGNETGVAAVSSTRPVA